MDIPSAGRRGRFPLFLLAGCTLLVLYGALGLLFALHLPERLFQAAALWGSVWASGHLPEPGVPLSWGLPEWLRSVEAHFETLVGPVWLAWGVGCLGLWLLAGRPADRRGTCPQRFAWVDVLVLLLLVGVLFLGGSLRARFLLPQSDGAVPASHYDEMVYLEGTLLWHHGVMPYSGFMLAHPPGILYAFWPATLFAEAWGGPAYLIAGRWVQWIYGVLTLVLLYLVGRRLGGRWGGWLAALVPAVDVQVVQVAPLETVVNLATVVALALYLAGQRVERRRWRFLLLALSGGWAMGAALTKAPGGVGLLLLALLALLGGKWWDLLAGAVGAAGMALLLAGPFFFPAAGDFWRQVLAFQILRPQETIVGRNHLARMAEYPESRLTFFLVAVAVVLATAVLLGEAWQAGLRRHPRRAQEGAAGWILPLVLTVLSLLLLFSYGRAYHSRYYIQLTLPLALLVAVGVGLFRVEWWSWPRWGRVLAGVFLLALVLFALPLLEEQRRAGLEVEYDGRGRGYVYGPVGEVLHEAVPEGAAVMALDPGYALMAGRPPVMLPDGTYLVDGSGLLFYRALGIGKMGWAEVWEAAQRLPRAIEPGEIEEKRKEVLHRPEAQDVIVSALYRAAAAVIDLRIAADAQAPAMTPQTQELVKTRGRQVFSREYTEAYLVERHSLLGQSRAGLSLWDVNLRVIAPDGRWQRSARPGEVLEVSPGEVVQVSLYTYVEEPPAGPLKVSLELWDDRGNVGGYVRGGLHGDGAWAAGWVYQDHYNLPIRPDVRLGAYRLYLALLDGTGKAVSWEGGEGRVFLGGVRVGR
ncbi:MAG: glycosyltransferase family 39 protein [Chloroflexia bacterium]